MMDLKNYKLDNLRILREKYNITQKKLAVDLEVTQELISHYEIGIVLPTASMLIKLSEYFKVSVDYILGLTDIPQLVNDFTKLKADELELIDLYRTLTTKDKLTSFDYIKFLSNK